MPPLPTGSVPVTSPEARSTWPQEIALPEVLRSLLPVAPCNHDGAAAPCVINTDVAVDVKPPTVFELLAYSKSPAA